MSSGEESPGEESAGRWIPVLGFVYALFCPVSEKYFEPFHGMLPHYFRGWLATFLTGGGFSAGVLLIRLLLLAPFILAIVFRRPYLDVLRRRAVAAGMYWPLIFSTGITVATSGYAIIWTWVLLPAHVAVAVAASVTANKLAPNLGRWVWLGVLFGLACWTAARFA